jgi:hypothetical protein
MEESKFKPLEVCCTIQYFNEDINFPKLMVGTKNTGLFVLFKNAQQGTVLNCDDGSYKIADRIDLDNHYAINSLFESTDHGVFIEISNQHKNK